MKKYISSLAVLSCLAFSSAVNAQDVVEVVSFSTQAENSYLPQQGEFAFGVDLVPIVRTIGDAFSRGNKYDNETFGGTPFLFDTEDMYTKPTVSIMGKYMITDHWAARINVGLRLRNINTRSYVDDQLGLYLNPNSEAKVVDSRKLTESGCTFMLGAEYRLGKRRVQGIFGFGVLAGFSTKSVSYSYGNKITDFNRLPVSAFNDESGQPAGYRVLSSNYEGPNAAVGAYGTIGVEWFVGRKIALGASVDLYCYGSWSSKAVVKSEGFNDAYNSIEHRTDVVSPGNRGVAFGTDNIGGSLYTIFYF